MKRLVSRLNHFWSMTHQRNFWIIVVLLAGITFLHYFSSQVRWFPFLPYASERHAFERILFLLPIAWAAFAFGQVGGIITLALTLVLMLPRAIGISPSPTDAILETLAVGGVGCFITWAIETQAREKRLRQDLSQQLEQAYDRLQTLYDSVQKVSSTLDLQSVLNHLVQATAQAMGVRGCSIRLLDETGQRLNVTAVYGLSQAYVQKGDLILEQNPLAREVLAGGVIAIGDLTTDERLQYPAQALAEGIRSMLSAPLLGKRGPLGLIRAYSTELNHFTSDDTTFLSAIASQGSVAIENAMAYQALGKLDQMKSKFVLTVTHELRSPVSVVRSLLRTLCAGFAGTMPSDQRDLIERALHNADFLQTLIDDLLDLARGKTELGVNAERANISLSEAIEEVVRRFLVPAEEKHITLEQHLEFGENPPQVYASQDDLDRIFTNLISNAVKYTSTGGHVVVRLHCRDGVACIEVADTGIGIPSDSLAHVFEEFYRAPNAKALEKHGTGLGLAITRDLVARSGGHIDVWSQVGEGTTFTVTFPLADK